MPTDQIIKDLPLTVQRDVPLAPFTTFKIGGPARYFASATSLDQLKELLLFARREEIPFCILGGGSNLLVSDDGFDGLAIRLQMDSFSVSGNVVEAEAGVDLTSLVHRTAQWGLSGIESLAGIPGSVGGAVRGNAGAYGGAVGEVTRSVQALDTRTLELATLDREECAFGYRNSRFKRDPSLVVVSARLELSPGEPEQIRAKIDATLEKREAKQLQCDRSAGSYFMNPVVTDPKVVRRFETDQGVHCRECRIPAGWLIDQARLRSLRVGDAMVSHRHANYLINTGSATAAQVVELARRVKEAVRATLGVQLQEEVCYLGFTPENDPKRPA